MTIGDAWEEFSEALEFAVSLIEGDPEPLNERERADGNLYITRILAAVSQSSVLRLDADHPSFLPMLDSVRYLGAAGPDIDYDVAAVRPNKMYRISGLRGDATYVGIAVYAGASESGATSIVRSVDVDEIVRADGTFTYEFSHPAASRVIIRQYFHSRETQAPGAWEINLVDAASEMQPISAILLPGPREMNSRIANAAKSLRWNAQLNQLWTPERRPFSNEFIRQTSEDIVAAIPNPDVIYAYTWWRKAEDEVLVIDFTPPETPYWALQICDRWYQCFPDRRSNINNGEVEANADGSVQIVISDGDPGAANWLDTSGHSVGIMFFRWLHADPETQPTCRAVKRSV
ncbi:MAG: DUF1214 domain-containing protein [Acidimicrobiales bacterium]